MVPSGVMGANRLGRWHRGGGRTRQGTGRDQLQDDFCTYTIYHILPFPSQERAHHCKGVRRHLLSLSGRVGLRAASLPGRLPLRPSRPRELMAFRRS